MANYHEIDIDHTKQHCKISQNWHQRSN